MNDAPIITRGGFLRGILAAGVAPAIIPVAQAHSVAGLRRGLALRQAMEGGAAEDDTPIYALKKEGSTSPAFYCAVDGDLPFDKTISMWVRYSNIVNGSKCCFKYGDEYTGIGLALFNESWRFLNERVAWVNSVKSVEFQVWHHIAVVIKQNLSFENTLFINGNLVHINNTTSIANAPKNMFSLCGRPRDDNANVVCEVSRVCIYDAALDATQIATDYGMGRRLPKSGLIHCWNGSVQYGKVKDLVGDWDLTMSAGCSISNETPWS